MFNEKAQVGLLFLDDIIAPCSLDTFPGYSLLPPAQHQSPQDVRDVFRADWLGIFRPPKGIQMDGGGEWKNEIWTDVCADRRIKLQFQGVGAHLWLLERRNGLARGIYCRFPSGQISSGVQ